MKWGFPNRRVYWTPLEESRLAPRPGLASGAHYKAARAVNRVRFVERNTGCSFKLRTTHHAHPGAEGLDHHLVRTEEAACDSCDPPGSLLFTA
ncbi:uncharacterized protein LOC117091648 isoform X2 [Trachypithecus francoisi]|uniref:uncharacterized protein LOC117091648 isoform X2 n=1 Tax=Trachypithecus francoisi TaxID=54180 RepID=UPI00141B26FE|nr:uncharacterized protein LOC117091648 isoform X2 [Trachypithecus francoisi]